MKKDRKVKVTLLFGTIFFACIIFSIPYLTRKYHESFVEGKTAFQMMKKDLSLEIPQSCKVLEYSYEKKSGYFAVKIQVEETVLQEVKDELAQCFSSDVNLDVNYQDHLGWWKFAQAQVVEAYYGIAATPNGKAGVKTVPVRAFITQENDQDFLYLDKYWCAEMEK